jgi:hypothetical protein
MTLVWSFLELVQPLSFLMTAPSFNTFVTILTGWVFAPRRTVTGMILAADVVGTRHHPLDRLAGDVRQAARAVGRRVTAEVRFFRRFRRIRQLVTGWTNGL